MCIILYGRHVTMFVDIFEYKQNMLYSHVLALEEKLLVHTRGFSSLPCIPNCPGDLWWSDPTETTSLSCPCREGKGF